MISNSMIIWMIDLSHLLVVLTSTWGDYLDYWPFGCSKEMGNLWNGVCWTVELNLTWERNPSESDGSLTHGQWHPVLLNQWYEGGKAAKLMSLMEITAIWTSRTPQKNTQEPYRPPFFRLECRHVKFPYLSKIRPASWKLEELGPFPVDLMDSRSDGQRFA